MQAHMRVVRLHRKLRGCFPVGADRIRFRTTAPETGWSFGSHEGTGNLGQHRLKRSQQVSHRWSKVTTHTVAHAPHFFTALGEYPTSFTLAAQVDEYLPQYMVGRQVSRSFRVSEEEMLRRLVPGLEASLSEQCLPKGEAT